MKKTAEELLAEAPCKMVDSDVFPDTKYPYYSQKHVLMLMEEYATQFTPPPMVREENGKFTKDEMYKAIEFGTELANTTGYAEGHDGWIDDRMDDFMRSLKPTSSSPVSGEKGFEFWDRRTHSVQNPCRKCGKDIREQMKGCNEITCYRQYL